MTNPSHLPKSNSASPYTYLGCNIGFLHSLGHLEIDQQVVCFVLQWSVLVWRMALDTQWNPSWETAQNAAKHGLKWGVVCREGYILQLPESGLLWECGVSQEGASRLCSQVLVILWYTVTIMICTFPKNDICFWLGNGKNFPPAAYAKCLASMTVGFQ